MQYFPIATQVLHVTLDISSIRRRFKFIATARLDATPRSLIVEWFLLKYRLFI